MIRNIYHKPPVNWVLLLMLLALLVVAVSCNVTKGKSSIQASTDSVSSKTVSVVDTGRGGNVSRGTSKEANDWWRETWQFPRDTNVTNVYPTAYIREGGTQTKEVQTFDSGWFKNALSLQQASMDSLHRELAEVRKDKGTRPSILLFVGLAVGVVVVWSLITGVFKKFKIVKV